MFLLISLRIDDNGVVGAMRRVFCLLLVIGAGLAAIQRTACADVSVSGYAHPAAGATDANLGPKNSFPVPIPPAAWVGLTLFGVMVTVSVIRRKIRNQP